MVPSLPEVIPPLPDPGGVVPIVPDVIPPLPELIPVVPVVPIPVDTLPTIPEILPVPPVVPQILDPAAPDPPASIPDVLPPPPAIPDLIAPVTDAVDTVAPVTVLPPAGPTHSSGTPAHQGPSLAPIPPAFMPIGSAISSPLGTGLSWSLFGGFLGSETGGPGSTGLGILQLLGASGTALFTTNSAALLAYTDPGSSGFGATAPSRDRSAPAAPPSRPAPAPDRRMPTQAPGGASAVGASASAGFFSGTLFATLVLLGLAALSTSVLAMASARVRPQAYIALLERPG